VLVIMIQDEVVHDVDRGVGESDGGIFVVVGGFDLNLHWTVLLELEEAVTDIDNRMINMADGVDAIALEGVADDAVTSAIADGAVVSKLREA
jgi:hypothetical protein